ncbi:MAG TPA: site-specific integrase [Ktedonobacterales bacterium]
MAGKRANGEGSVRRRADGRWEATITLPNGKRKSYYRKTRAEASAALTAALRDLVQGVPIVAEKQTLAEYLSWWLDSSSHGLAPRTVTRYRSHVTSSLVPALGRIRLAKLSPQPIQALYTAKLEGGVAPGTVRQMHAVLRRALGEAARLGLVPRNVATLVKVPKPTRHEMQVLSPDEARVLLTSVEGDRLEALYVLALTTGMRLGELLALRWSDVDLHAKAPALHVRATLRYVNAGTYFFEPPKTPKSRRRIALSAKALDALRRHRARQLEERLAAGPAWKDEDLVFCTPVGRALCGNHLSGRDFQALLKRASLPRVRFHDLRHTCATLLLRRGVHPKVVSELLGHATVTMTLDRYSHVLPDMQQAAREAMDGLLG